LQKIDILDLSLSYCKPNKGAIFMPHSVVREAKMFIKDKAKAFKQQQKVFIFKLTLTNSQKVHIINSYQINRDTLLIGNFYTA